jgi:hypothetical protein
MDVSGHSAACNKIPDKFLMRCAAGTQASDQMVRALLCAVSLSGTVQATVPYSVNDEQVHQVKALHNWDTYAC